MRRELERIEILGEHDARERSWAVVRAAFAERGPTPRRRSWKPIAAIAFALAALAGLLSPPGRAVLDEIREVVGVEESAPGLFSLPAPGRLLVTADSGAWVVDEDGSKRLLGTYREASWSPFGRFVVASRRNELVALTPKGDVRWSLARPDVRFPRWGGTRTDTRIAYLSAGTCGSWAGTARATASRPPARGPAPSGAPGSAHVLIYERRDGSIRVVDVDTGAQLERKVPQTFLSQVDLRLAHELLGAGDFAPPVRSPDGNWLAVGWPEADQLVFVRAEGGRQLRAVANVSSQFRSRSFPTIEGWCCAP